MNTHVMPTYARLPIAFESGEGSWLTDTSGNRYLDTVTGIAVCNLGHCHPAVTKAIQQQAEKLVHTSNLFQVPLQEKLADLLCAASGMEQVFFTNSGAEANEAAIKVARLYGNKKGVSLPSIIVMEQSFHGRTMATLTATGNEKVHAGFEPLVQGFVRVPYNDTNAVKSAIESNDNIVAILVEPVQGEGGVNIPDAGYLSNLKSLCQQHDLLFMLDEVQTGNGRTGKYFAFQHEDAKPDVLTTAKGLGNGMPIGACMVSGQANDIFSPGNHGTTYGGNPLACAAAIAVAEELSPLLENIDTTIQQLYSAIESDLLPHSAVESIRHHGMMFGIKLTQDALDLPGMALEHGIIVNITAGNVIRLLPALNITEQDVTQLTKKLGALLDAWLAKKVSAVS